MPNVILSRNQVYSLYVWGMPLYSKCACTVIEVSELGKELMKKRGKINSGPKGAVRHQDSHVREFV